MSRPPLQIKQDMASNDTFRSEIKHAWGSHRLKLIIIWHLKTGEYLGLTRANVARIAHTSTRELQRWIHAYNKDGIDGLERQQPRRARRKNQISNLFWEQKLWPLVECLWNPYDRKICVGQLQRALERDQGILIEYSVLLKTLQIHRIDAEKEWSGIFPPQESSEESRCLAPVPEPSAEQITKIGSCLPQPKAPLKESDFPPIDEEFLRNYNGIERAIRPSSLLAKA